MVEGEDGQRAAEEGAERPHQRAAKAEDRGDAPERGPHRLKDGDLLFLVVHEEDEERNDVGAGDDQDDRGDEEEERPVAPELLEEIFCELELLIGRDFPVGADAAALQFLFDFSFLLNYQGFMFPRKRGHSYTI